MSSVFEYFLNEANQLTFTIEDSAPSIIDQLTRAVKRAQLRYDAEQATGVSYAATSEIPHDTLVDILTSAAQAETPVVVQVPVGDSNGIQS